MTYKILWHIRYYLSQYRYLILNGRLFKSLIQCPYFIINKLLTRATLSVALCARLIYLYLDPYHKRMRHLQSIAIPCWYSNTYGCHLVSCRTAKINSVLSIIVGINRSYPSLKSMEHAWTCRIQVITLITSNIIHWV